MLGLLVMGCMWKCWCSFMVPGRCAEFFLLVVDPGCGAVGRACLSFWGVLVFRFFFVWLGAVEDLFFVGRRC